MRDRADADFWNVHTHTEYKANKYEIERNSKCVPRQEAWVFLRRGWGSKERDAGGVGGGGDGGGGDGGGGGDAATSGGVLEFFFWYVTDG